MRVLMTADAVGGVWTYALDLSVALAAHDVDVVLATMGPRPSDAQREQVRRLGNVRLVESDYRLEWMTDPWSDVSSAGEWLLDLANETSPDVVHVNGYSHAALPWKRPVVCVAHSCVVTWWHAVHREQPPAAWDTYRRNVTLGLNQADRVIAPTEAFLEQLQSCYGVNQPCEVIRNGRPRNIFSPSSPAKSHDPANATSSAKAHDLSDDASSAKAHDRADEASSTEAPDPASPASSADGHGQGRAASADVGRHASRAMPGRVAPGGGREDVLIGCGRLWDAAKNLQIFDAAAEGLPWRAYVIGDAAGPEGQRFVPKAVQALGAMSHDEVEAWLQRASIFVHPALYEPFGLAVLEAAAAGCALVLSDIPTLRELWNGAAEFHDPRDITQLRRSLNNLIEHPAKREALAAAAQRRAAEYSVDSTAAAYAKVYRILSRNHSRHHRAVA